jgi:hypothetical protein
LFALLYHCVMAERLRERPERVVEHARQNIWCWMTEDSAGGERRTLDERWKILDSSLVARLIEIITEGADEGQHLRS